MTKQEIEEYAAPIKKWLKETGRDREWLAEQCAVEKSTIDGWMSNRPIPRHAKAIIAGLMFAEKPVSPQFSLETFAKIQQAAKAKGISVKEFCELAVKKALEAPD